MSKGRVYVTQYEGWWSFSKAEWIKFVKYVLDSYEKGGGYELPFGDNWTARNIGGRYLKNRPKHIVRMFPGEYSDTNWMSKNEDDVLVFPLDMTNEEWEWELKEMEEAEENG